MRVLAELEGAVHAIPAVGAGQVVGPRRLPEGRVESAVGVPIPLAGGDLPILRTRILCAELRGRAHEAELRQVLRVVPSADYRRLEDRVGAKVVHSAPRGDMPHEVVCLGVATLEGVQLLRPKGVAGLVAPEALAKVPKNRTDRVRPTRGLENLHHYQSPGLV